MGASGIDITGFVAAEKVIVALNGGAGIRTTGGAGRFVDVTAASNLGDGLAEALVHGAAL